MKFLVVDDCQDGADSLTMLLEIRGFEASCVYDGKSAIRSVRDAAPDVILMDLGMIGFDGFDTALAIRLILPVGTAKLAALTGWTTAAARERAATVGFDYYFVKPISLDEMLVTMTGSLTADASCAESRRKPDRRNCGRVGEERRHSPPLGAGARRTGATVST